MVAVCHVCFPAGVGICSASSICLMPYRSCEHWSRIESGVRHIPLHILDSFCKITGASYEEVLFGTTDVPITPNAPLEPRQYYERQFAEIIAAYPDEVVERILEICRQAVCLVDL